MESEGEDEESHKHLQQLTDSTLSASRDDSKTGIPFHRPARQLWLHAALMCGRDFLYAIEVVLVTPILLQLGMPQYLYSYTWFISPTFGLILGPLLGNWSDKCTLRWGRRRPFILSFVIGTVVGLTLMILSKDLATVLSNNSNQQRTIGLAFGIVGTQIMDFCLDQLEAPLRAYTLDVCSPADQQRAFTLQSLAMGTGAALGFIVDGIKWNEIFNVESQDIQIKVVYVFAITIYFIVTIMTLTSIKEIQWTKPRKKAKIVKDIDWKKQNGSHHIKARKMLSEPAIPNRKHRSITHHVSSSYIQNKRIPDVIVERDSSNAVLNSHGTPEPHRSSAVKSITVLPRISLCKSVFMTMSCPEGLNETDTSSTSITSFDLQNDESSSDESAKKDDSQDSIVFGHSLPDLSKSNSKKLNLPKLLEVGRKTLSSSTNVSSSESLKSFEMDDMNSTNLQCHVKEDYSSNQFKEGTTKNRDLNSNGAVRKIELDEKPLLQRNSKPMKFTKRKEKKNRGDEIGEGEEKPVSTGLLWLSIMKMPTKLRYLCFSLLISFMGIEIEMLWYTTIFGSVVYGGDPTAPANSTELQLYNDGVHMGCWGLTIYAATVIVFSIAMEHFDILTKVSTRFLYAGGQLVTAVSTMAMFLFPTEFVILFLSWTFGITVSTSLIVPYLLVGKYHLEREFVMNSPGGTRRGFGTDCSILACQMYAGNLMYAAVSGPVIYSYGGVRIVLAVASVCHMVAFVICMWFVTYPGERSYKFCNCKPRTNVENIAI